MNDREKALKMLEKARFEGAVIAFQSVVKVLDKDKGVPDHIKNLVKALHTNSENEFKKATIALKIMNKSND